MVDAEVVVAGIWTCDTLADGAIDLPLLRRITEAMDLEVEAASVTIAGRRWTWRPMSPLTVVMPSQGAPHAFAEEPEP